MSNDLNILQNEAVELLKKLIATPSFSREEDQTANLLCKFIGEKEIPHYRIGNNVFALNKNFNQGLPSILLNSHHDTVKPNKGYTLDPFEPIVNDGKLFGLGSNDAGGALVSLLATFLHFFNEESLKYNLVFAATAEEEISGHEGIEALLKHDSFSNQIGNKGISFALVGEPTQMRMAIAEKGLLVLDCLSEGIAGHAAREEGDNVIYKAIKDIEWFRNYSFPKVSELLGPMKMSITVINTDNKAHNVVPAQCSFVADIRINELYSFEEVLETIRKNVSSSVTPRSLRMRSSSIPVSHPIVEAGKKLNLQSYGSPTTSDQALMPFPALKIGPGDSARSHTADEYIYMDEIKSGIETYINMLELVL